MTQPIDEVISPINGIGSGGGEGPGTVAWGDITGTLSNQTDVDLALDAKVDESTLGVANGVATLDSAGYVKLEQLPVTVITEVFVVNDQTEMLALSAQVGDVAIRLDLSKSYILQGTDPASLSDWTELLSPPNAVSSVNGQTGAALLDADDIDDSTTSHKFVTASEVTLINSAIQPGNSALTDSREWTASTVPQAEAEAGVATTRRAWTAERVFQAIASWWNGSSAKVKLDGIATGATANQTDAHLLNRANHTGTQVLSTISDAGDLAALDTITKSFITDFSDTDYATAAQGTLADSAVQPATLTSGLAGKQDTITGAATTVTSSNLTASRVLVSDGSGKIAVSSVTGTTLGYLDATSSIQTQINSKASTGTTVGQNLLNLANPGAVAFVRINADNTVSARSALNLRGDLGLGTLSTLSTVNDGNWSGTDLSVANGGTGASDAATARTNLGLGSMSLQNIDSFIAAGLSMSSTPMKLIGDFGGDTSSSSYVMLSKLDDQSRIQGVLYAIRGSSNFTSSATWLINGSTANSSGAALGRRALSCIALSSGGSSASGNLVTLTHGGVNYIALEFTATGNNSFRAFYFQGLVRNQADLFIDVAANVSNVVAYSGGTSNTLALLGTTLPHSSVSGLGTLATLSTVNNTQWSGTDLAITNGGTGASDAATARTNLGAASTAVATTSSNGLMSLSDKTKLDAIPSHVPYVQVSVSSLGMVTVVGSSTGISASVVSQTNESDLIMSFTLSAGHGLSKLPVDISIMVEWPSTGEYAPVPSFPYSSSLRYVNSGWSAGNFPIAGTTINNVEFFALPIPASTITGYIFFT